MTRSCLSPPALASRPRSRPGARRARGFTLLEVLAALLIASIFAALALPTMSSRMRDRRAQQYAQEMALFYREGRSRAIGRGSAHLVRFSTAVDAHGAVQLYEAIQAVGSADNVGSCENLPRVALNGCSTVNWEGGTQARKVTEMGSRGKLYEGVYATFRNNGSAQASADICFTPGGRSYFRTAPGSTFVPFTSVMTIRVMMQPSPDITFANAVSRLGRDILLLPNGNARVETVLVP